MKRNISYIASPTSNYITLMLDGKVLTVETKDESYPHIIQAIKDNDEDTILRYFDKAAAMQNYVYGNVEINAEGEFKYKGEVLKNYLTDKLTSMWEAELPIEPFIRFLDKLYSNPSKRAIDELFKFLEHKNIPIADDGDFLAYKAVGPDFYSKTAGVEKPILGRVSGSNGNYRIFNGIGETVQMKRSDVDDDYQRGCSNGLHAGSLEYATSFGHGNDKMVIVKINPADAVSVPSCCSFQKLRCTGYKVIEEFKGALPELYVGNTNNEDIAYKTVVTLEDLSNFLEDVDFDEFSYSVGEIYEILAERCDEEDLDHDGILTCKLVKRMILDETQFDVEDDEETSLYQSAIW